VAEIEAILENLKYVEFVSESLRILVFCLVFENLVGSFIKIRIRMRIFI